MFALFAGDTYYPTGGWDDLVGVYETLREAEVAANYGWKDRYDTDAVQPYDWYHIVDLDTRKVVSEG